MSRRLPTRVLAIWLAALGVMALAGEAAAQPTQVEVIYLVAHAHNDDAETDRKLAPVAQALSTLGFTGYDFISSGKWTMAAGEHQSVKLEDTGYTLQIQLESIGTDGARVTVYLTRPDKSDPAKISLTIRPNAVAIFGGTSYRSGKLVVPVRIKYP